LLSKNKNNLFQKIITKFKSEDGKLVLTNFISLSILQVLNIILPLLTMPYLVRVLGAEYFGLLAIATSIITYFTILTNYGFNITATREISVNRVNKLKIIEIYSSVMIIKFFFIIVSFILLCIVVFSVDKFAVNWEIYFLTFGVLIGQVLFPIWFFQGMEQMKYITYLNVLSKTIFTILIFVFVQKESDYFIVPILTSLGFLVVGVWSLILIRKKFDIHFKFQGVDILKYHLYEGWHIFISNLSVTMYTTTTTVLLGIFTNNTIVGYYSIADKLISGIKQLITPISQTLYPFVSRKAEESKELVLGLIKKTAFFSFFLSLLLTIFLFVFAESILYLVFGNEAKNSVLIFKILTIIPLLAVIDTVFGTLLMLVFKRNKEYSKIIISAGLLNLILALVLIPLFDGNGAAFSVLIVELYITIRIVFYTQNNGLKIMGR
jgi:PST family polysaccharide transporter